MPLKATLPLPCLLDRTLSTGPKIMTNSYGATLST